MNYEASRIDSIMAGAQGMGSLVDLGLGAKSEK